MKFGLILIRFLPFAHKSRKTIVHILIQMQFLKYLNHKTKTFEAQVYRL